MAARTYAFTRSGSRVSIIASDGVGDRNISIPCDIVEKDNGIIQIMESDDIVWSGKYSDVTSINGSTPTTQDTLRTLLTTCFSSLEEGFLQTMVSTLDSIDQKIPPKGATSMAASVPVVTSNQLITIGVEMTRPADTNSYIQYDSISNSTSAPTALTFSGLPANAKGYITKIRIMSDSLVMSTQSVALFLNIYNQSVSAINDNAAFTLLYTNADKRCITKLMPAFTTLAATSTAAITALDSLAVEFEADSSGNIYALLATNTAITTPASGTKFYVFLTFDISNIG